MHVTPRGLCGHLSHGPLPTGYELVPVEQGKRARVTKGRYISGGAYLGMRAGRVFLGSDISWTQGTGKDVYHGSQRLARMPRVGQSEIIPYGRGLVRALSRITGDSEDFFRSAAFTRFMLGQAQSVSVLDCAF